MLEKKGRIPITPRNLVWRLVAPLTVLEMLGIILDRAFHLHKFFKVGLAVTAIILTIWGLYTTISKLHHQESL